MNNNQELTALANEFKATMNHAEKIFNRYMAVAIDLAISEAINELSDVDKMILLLGLMTGAVEDKIVFDLEELLAGKDMNKNTNDKIVFDLEELLSGKDMNKNTNDKIVKVPSRLRMPLPKTFVEEIVALYGNDFVIHILG
jgi:hypothetical protein